ncbi:type III pantothenate kinase [Geminisphaera colitermitum]|uniref:type III pantothenate kinase n=1 Tax=Geminisphaera colitermitum TaxID=1148786 RepID=UPI000158CD63|nr:type III pantothenate kinase [Geminisphaera colitermitum]
MLLCVDIGNTHTHYGLVQDRRTSCQSDVPTRLLDDPVLGLPERIKKLRAMLRQSGHVIDEIAFCSVVPDASPRLRDVAAGAGLASWQLDYTCALGVPISYPRPTEIGQDRLANAAGAHALVGSPAVVIDLGTAVTFDIITTQGGYEGGIITPGPALVTRYLHEHTAQLPLVEDLVSPVQSVVGKSTKEAIRIGAIIGYPGMIQALLDAVLGELAARAEPTPVIVTSGGAASMVAARLRQPTRDIPDLTLQGLAAAHALRAGS